MEITHMKLDDLYKALSVACRSFDGRYGCFGEASGMACPFAPEEGEGVEVRCWQIRPEHWRLVFEGEDEQEPEPEPGFRFGDRVTVDGMKAIFVRYTSEDRKSACIVFDKSVLLPTRLAADLKAGWHG